DPGRHHHRFRPCAAGRRPARNHRPAPGSPGVGPDRRRRRKRRRASLNKTLPGLLIVLSAPSGAGKGSVRRELAKLEPDLIYGVSVTTRPPRPGERDGQHYFFTDEEDFRARAARGELVEWSEVYGHLYGTPREPMETYIREGRDVIVEKDVQGARKIMALYPKAVTIFILPPSLEELRRRIESRGTESPEAQRQRLRSA